ncbi:MAG: GTPase HflX [Anaerolineae bacterium]
MSETIEKKTLKAFLVGVESASTPGVLEVEASLEELALLADTAGLHVIGQVYQRVRHPHPATYIGSGKVEEVQQWVEELGADVVLFDDELSPRHQRELEKIFGENVRVMDRTELILDIFAQHAHTREGALQVSLAQYEYRLPRLTRQWTHLARQVGGAGARGGASGVGLRGPGETQLETDRREIRRYIARLKQELEQVRAHRERHRTQRRRAGIPVVSLVGYTNAGKSTLLNRLSGADVYVADQLFATLDPTTRRVELTDGTAVLFTDTVGFIQKLPHSLVAAFRATLEEINEADLLLHVVDASHVSAQEQVRSVEHTLYEELGIADIPLVMVLNKVDRLAEADADRSAYERLRERYPDAVSVSALTGAGIDDLLGVIADRLRSRLRQVRVRLPYREAALVSRFHALATVLEEVNGEEAVELTGLIAPQHLELFKAFIVSDRP